MIIAALALALACLRQHARALSLAAVVQGRVALGVKVRHRGHRVAYAHRHTQKDRRSHA